MDLQVILDRMNFPLILIEPGRFYMYWLPITKIQLEYFLSSGSIAAFDARWYEEVLYYNDRVTPSLITTNNYWEAFVTGVKPSEIKQFISWLGREYDLPTSAEWKTAYEYLKKENADPGFIEKILGTPGLNRRARTLIANINHSVNDLRVETRGGRKLADQALMRLGVMEYVYRDDRRNTYGGHGQPNSDFFGTTETAEKEYPQRLVDEHEGAKMPHYGFRLIKRMQP